MAENTHPGKLLFSMNCFTGPAFILKWDDNKLLYGMTENGKYVELDNKEAITPDNIKWVKFWSDVRNIGVWYWQKQYDNEICDGIEWELELVFGGREISSRGFGAYPPKATESPSEAFKQLLRAFGELMSDQEFIRRWYINSWD